MIEPHGRLTPVAGGGRDSALATSRAEVRDRALALLFVRRTASHFRIDPGLVVALLLATYAMWPLLTRPGLPTFNDGEQHVYRTLEVMANWQAGVPYARWAPDVYHGFGSAVFNYYSPLIYYLAGAYAWLGGGPVAGVKFVMILAAYLGAAGMYVLVRGLWGSPAGLAGAAVFSLSPYLVYIDPVARCDVSELLALAIVPWLLWAFRRVLLDGGAPHQAFAAAALAALVFAHNLVALVFFAWLLGWLAVIWLDARREETGVSLAQVVRRALPPIMVGVGLAACLWLPAVLERNAVRLSDATVGYLDFRRAFVPWEVLFRPASVIVTPELQLGVPEWVVAVLGMLSLFFVRERRTLVAWLALSIVLMIGLMLPAALPVWETVPLLSFLQFPWRLLAPAMVVCALLAGALINWCARRPVGKVPGDVVGLTAIVVACLVASFPLLDPLPWADFNTATVQRLVTAGLDWWAGTTASNEFLPATVQALPPYEPALVASYKTGQIDKVDLAQLPPGAQATVVAHTAVQDQLQLTSSAPFTLTLYTFDFPGWTAYLDGIKTAIVPSQPQGWITMAVPPGNHEVRVRFEDTWPRQLGEGLTFLAALGWAGLWVFRRRRVVSAQAAVAPLAMRPAMVLGCVVMLGLGVRHFADQSSWWRAKPNPVPAPAAQHALWVPLESNLALIGYDLPSSPARPGDTIAVTLYWEAFAPVTRNLRVFVHLLGADGAVGGVSDIMHPGGYLNLPTSRWPLFRYVRDDHTFTIDPAAPAETYTLRAGLWDEFADVRMHTLDANGQPTDQDGVILTDSFVVRP